MAYAPEVQHSQVNTHKMATSCDLCASACSYYAHTDSKPSTQETYELFHEPCSDCTPAAPSEEVLCKICRHLRLRHLVRCVDRKTRRQYNFLLRRTHVATRCSFCHLVTDMLAAALGAEKLKSVIGKDYKILLYLGYPQISETWESDVSADLYACNDDDESFVWVGDLRIDDARGNNLISKWEILIDIEQRSLPAAC